MQGLADAFLLLGLAFDSPEAQELNRHVFETIYYAALDQSCELAKVEGTYETYAGCPVSKGILQPDMWDVKPDSGRWVDCAYVWAGAVTRYAGCLMSKGILPN